MEFDNSETCFGSVNDRASRTINKNKGQSFFSGIVVMQILPKKMQISDFVLKLYWTI